MNNSLLVTVQSDQNDHTYVAHQIAEFLAYRGYTNVNLLATHSIDEVETMMRVAGHPIEHPQRGDSMWLGHDRHIVVAMDEPRSGNENRSMHYIDIRDRSPLWLPAMPTHEFDDPDFGKEKPSADDLKVLQSLIDMTSLAAVMEFIKKAVATGGVSNEMLDQIMVSREAAVRSFFSSGETVVTDAGKAAARQMPNRTTSENDFRDPSNPLLHETESATGNFFTTSVDIHKVAQHDGVISDEGMEMLSKANDTSALHADLADDELKPTVVEGLNREPSLQPISSTGAFFDDAGPGRITDEHGGRGTAVPVTEDSYDKMHSANPTANRYGPVEVTIHTQPDEPFFVLLGRDPQAADLVDQWAVDRNQMEMGNPKVTQAMDIANLMRQFKEANPHLGLSKNLYEEKLGEDLMYLIPRQKPYTEDDILKMAMVVTEAAALSGVELNVQHNTCFTHQGVQNQVDQQIGQMTKIAAAANVEVVVVKLDELQITEVWGTEKRVHQLFGPDILKDGAQLRRPGEYSDMDERNAIEITGLNVMDRNLDEMQSRPQSPLKYSDPD